MQSRYVYSLLLMILLIVSIREAKTVMTVQSPPCVKVCPPDIPPPTANPVDAIGRLAMQGGFCSATVVGPPRPDGRVILVSAAHCFKRVGETASFTTRTGRQFQVSVVALDRTPDCAILLSSAPESGLPFLTVSTTLPPIGSRVLQAGFGVHIPGNTEFGTVLSGETSQKQLTYRLSVSSGDSGGGIVLDSGGRYLSPVCCTTNVGGVGSVFAASPFVVSRMIAQPTEFIDLPPIAMPPPPVDP